MDHHPGATHKAELALATSRDQPNRPLIPSVGQGAAAPRIWQALERVAALVGIGVLALVVMFGLWVLLSALVGCERKQTYGQSTPDQVLSSALAMVRDNQTRQLSTLIYAESPEMRVVVDRLGVLLGNMHELSRAAQERFPDEFEKMRAEAEAAAASGKASTLIGSIVSSQSRGRGRRSTGQGGLGPDQARVLVNQLFADPFGWLETNAKRLTTISPTDDTAFVLLDGQPAIPVIGLGMRRSGDKWFIALPTSVPPVSSVWPRSRVQWSILASIIKTVDNAVIEITQEVKSGGVAGLDALVDRASDKLLFTAGLAFVAYGKELDVRSRVDRRSAQFSRRLRAWVDERKASGPADSIGVAKELVEVIESITPALIEKGVRANSRAPFEEMSLAQFEDLLREWLAGVGLAVDFSGDLASQSVVLAAKGWKPAGK